MSQPVGFQYKSRVPSFSDDASITEALKVYHYGVDDYTTETIPDDSIEGNFRSLSTSITALESAVSGLGTTYIEHVSLTANPNIITGQSTTTIPLIIRAITSQTAPLIQLQNSLSVSVGSISTGGFANLSGYLTIGSTTQSTTTGVNVVVGSASHIGVTIRAQSSQTANLQEWQSNSGTAISWVDKDGKIFSESSQVFTTSSNIPQASVVNLVTDLSTKFPLNVSTNSKTASYTLVLSDAQKIIEMNVATANTLTVPLDSSVNFPIGTSILLIQTGSGQTTVAGAVGVTVNSFIGLKIIGRWAGCTLVKRAANTWVAVGGLVA
jgi:hypothetical protein